MLVVNHNLWSPIVGECSQGSSIRRIQAEKKLECLTRVQSCYMNQEQQSNVPWVLLPIHAGIGALGSPFFLKEEGWKSNQIPKCQFLRNPKHLPRVLSCYPRHLNDNSKLSLSNWVQSSAVDHLDLHSFNTFLMTWNIPLKGCWYAWPLLWFIEDNLQLV